MTREELTERVELIGQRIEKLADESEQESIDALLSEVSEIGY